MILYFEEKERNADIRNQRAMRDNDNEFDDKMEEIELKFGPRADARLGR
jgi:hypothetical protein